MQFYILKEDLCVGCRCHGREHPEYNTSVPDDDSTMVLFSLLC